MVDIFIRQYRLVKRVIMRARKLERFRFNFGLIFSNRNGDPITSKR